MLVQASIREPVTNIAMEMREKIIICLKTKFVVVIIVQQKQLLQKLLLGAAVNGFILFLETLNILKDHLPNL